MQCFDVTRTIVPDMAVYPGDPLPEFSIQSHGGVRITGLHLCTHTGTHIDAPSHYLKDGAPIDQVPLTHLIGMCRLIDLSSVHGEISAHDLKGRIGSEQRVLIKTAYSGRTGFDPRYASLAPEAAHLLASAGMRCVGIDSPSIEAFSGNGTVHRTLLTAGTVIIEWLDLSAVPEGEYQMIALPLRLGGLDGSPARVVLCAP